MAAKWNKIFILWFLTKDKPQKNFQNIAAIISLKNPPKKVFFVVFALSGEKVCFSYNHTFFRLNSLLVRPDVMGLFAPLSTPGGCVWAPFSLSRNYRKICAKSGTISWKCYSFRHTKATKCTYNQALKGLLCILIALAFPALREERSQARDSLSIEWKNVIASHQSQGAKLIHFQF